MKTNKILSVLIIIAFIIIGISKLCFAQDNTKVIIVSPIVGEVIDLLEKEQYNLFSYYSNAEFHAAQFLKKPDGSIILKAVMKDGSIKETPISKDEFLWTKNLIELKSDTNDEHVKDDITTNGRKFYVKIGSGYATTFNKMSNTSNVEFRYSLATSTIYEEVESIRTSFGKGFNFQAAIGKKLNENFSLELSASYLKSSPIKSTVTFNYIIADDDVFYYTEKGKALSFTPTIVFSTKTKKITPFNIKGAPVFIKVTPYLNAGIILAFISFTSQYEFEGYGDKVFSLRKYTGGEKITKGSNKGILSTGFKVSLGIATNLSKKLSIFTEVSLTSLTFSPTESEIIEYTINGQDILLTLTESERKAVYLDEYTIPVTFDSNGNIVEDVDESSPSKRSRFDVPFGSIGINIGLKYEF